MTRAEEFDYILTPTQKGGTIPDVVVMEGHPGLQSTLRLGRGYSLGHLVLSRVQDAAAAVRGFIKPAHRATCLCMRASVHLDVCHGRCVFIAEVASFSTNRHDVLHEEFYEKSLIGCVHTRFNIIRLDKTTTAMLQRTAAAPSGDIFLCNETSRR